MMSHGYDMAKKSRKPCKDMTNTSHAGQGFSCNVLINSPLHFALRSHELFPCMYMSCLPCGHTEYHSILLHTHIAMVL